MSEIIFLSTPYSHPDKEVIKSRMHKTNKATGQILASGDIIMSVVSYGHTLLDHQEMPSNWEFWKNFCESFMVKCSSMIVYKLAGWEESTGVKGEIELAESLNLPIYYLEDELDYGINIPKILERIAKADPERNSISKEPRFTIPLIGTFSINEANEVIQEDPSASPGRRHSIFDLIRLCESLKEGTAY